MAPSGSVLTQLSDVENVLLGMSAGVASKCVNYPLLVWKNAVQQGKPIILNPTKVYRGLPMACLNLGGATAVQFGLAGFFQKLFTKGERALKPSEEIVAALCGGFFSGVPCSLWELVMIRQQNFGGTILGTPISLVQNHGVTVLGRGMIMTCAREAIFTMGMLGLCPVVKSAIHQQGYNDNLALAGGALTASFVSATMTHPCDTTKTCMQGDCEQNKYSNIRNTMRVIHAERGMGGYFAGLQWRIGLITTTFFLANRFKDILAPILFSNKFSEKGSASAVI